MNEDRDETALPTGWLEQLLLADETLPFGQEPDCGNVELLPAQRLIAQLRTIHDPHFVELFEDPEPGLPDHVGRYHVRRFLGSGGFAIVYLAEDRQRQRQVALKIPLPPRLLNGEARLRFIQEAQAAARLDHPHIVPAYEAGEDGPVPFIAYAYCSGPTLATWLRQHGPAPPRRAAQLVARLADAVHYSHQRGILHRDIKPANVLLFPQPASDDEDLPYCPRLADFGLAKLIEAAAADSQSSMIVGTPLYLAPEQLTASQSAGTATDVYGLGMLLYESLAGHPPYPGRTVIEVLEAIRRGPLPSLRSQSPRIPADLATICEKACARLPRDRYESPAHLKNDLLRYLQGERIHARPVSLLTRFWRSLSAPQRIREASGFVILSNLSLIAWKVISLAATGTGGWLGQGDSLVQLLPSTLPMIFLQLMLVLVGQQIGRRKLWAAISAALAGGVLVAVHSATVLRSIPLPELPIYPDIQSRDNTFVFLTCLYLLQLALSACAAMAIARRSTE